MPAVGAVTASTKRPHLIRNAALIMFAVVLLAASLETLSGLSTDAASHQPPQAALTGDLIPPAFDPNSVPAELRSLEGRIAYVTIPGLESPLLAARGAIMRGNVQTEWVTKENVDIIPLPLAKLEQQMDSFAQGYTSEKQAIESIRQISDRTWMGGPTVFAMLKEGTEVRIIAPNVNGGFASQVLPVTGKWGAQTNGGRQVHLWINSCFLRLGDDDNQQSLLGRRCR